MLSFNADIDQGAPRALRWRAGSDCKNALMEAGGDMKPWR